MLPASLVVLVGCQDQSRLDQSLPLPNLGGPLVAQPTARPTAALPVRPVIPPARSASNVPAGWIPPARSHGWRYIVIHHSATPRGGARAFDQAHRRRGWDGLGYHFVIGNGTDSGDGQVEVGSRWTRQIHGAHAGSRLYNDYGIGICLVGDFNIDRPTAAQTQSLARLVAYLMDAYRIPASRVLGHRDCKPTDCPGHFVDISTIRRLANQRISSGLANR